MAMTKKQKISLVKDLGRLAQALVNGMEIRKQKKPQGNNTMSGTPQNLTSKKGCGACG